MISNSFYTNLNSDANNIVLESKERVIDPEIIKIILNNRNPRTGLNIEDVSYLINAYFQDNNSEVFSEVLTQAKSLR